VHLPGHRGPTGRSFPRSLTWAQFIKGQASGIPACDLFSVKTITLARLYCFAVVEHTTRRVHVLGVTRTRRLPGVTQQARNLMLDLNDRTSDLRFLIRDRDSTFTALFDEVFKTDGIRVVLTAPQAVCQLVRLSLGL
jgi:putative transposase